MPSSGSPACALLGIVLIACTRATPSPAERSPIRVEAAGTSEAPAPAPPSPALEREPGLHVGVITASEKADIAPVVAGEVMAVHVRPGDIVEAGRSLATLDARRVREDLRMTEATLRSEKAALDQATVDRQEAASRLVEVEALAAAGAATQGSVKDLRFEYQRTRAAEARAAAVVAQWKARREQLERQLEDTELRAPFTAIVAERYVDSGGMTGPGAPVVRLISSASLWVRFAVPPSDLGVLAVGTIVTARLDDPAHTVEATVRHIAPETDTASQLVFIDAELDLDARLRSRVQVGTAAAVRLTVSPRG